MYMVDLVWENSSQEIEMTRKTWVFRMTSRCKISVKVSKCYYQLIPANIGGLRVDMKNEIFTWKIEYQIEDVKLAPTSSAESNARDFEK